jgi:hypothetical protein
MADENLKGFDISIAPLPRDYDYSPQDLANAIAERLIINFKDNTGTFIIGDDEPSSDQGPWLNTNFDPAQWYVFSPSAGRYVPAGVPQERLKYILSVNEPDKDIYDMWVWLSPTGKIRDIKHHNGNRWVGMMEELLIKKVIFHPGEIADIDLPYAICDGSTVNGIITPSLQGKYLASVGGNMIGTQGNTVGGHTVNLSHTHGTGSYNVNPHQLTVDEMPSHGHIAPNQVEHLGAGSNLNTSRGGGTTYTGFQLIAINETGGNGTHIHGFTGSSGSGLTSTEENRPETYLGYWVMYVGFEYVAEYADI